MMIIFDFSPLHMNIMAAYATHADQNKDEIRKFYKEIKDNIDIIPNHEIIIIFNEFNIRFIE